MLDWTCCLANELGDVKMACFGAWMYRTTMKFTGLRSLLIDRMIFSVHSEALTRFPSARWSSSPSSFSCSSASATSTRWPPSSPPRSCWRTPPSTTPILCWPCLTTSVGHGKPGLPSISLPWPVSEVLVCPVKLLALFGVNRHAIGRDLHARCWRSVPTHLTLPIVVWDGDGDDSSGCFSNGLIDGGWLWFVIYDISGIGRAYL